MEKEKLTHALTLRFTPEQRAEMQIAASAKGLKFSAWIRMVALEAARGRLVKALRTSFPNLKRSDPAVEKVPAGDKHKYLMPLDPEMRKRIIPLAKPYPKRAKQAMTDNQSEQRQGSNDPHAPNTGDVA